MPKHRNRPFNKNNSVTFKLVHRSQQDPLIADQSAPQFVLQECKSSSAPRRGKNAELQEQAKYGVYYDDDYDYLQHLKSVHDLDETEADLLPVAAKNSSRAKSDKIMLPSSLFPSEVQNAEGMLAGAVLPVGPQPDWDPDVVAAMEEDFDFDDPENQLEDDFVIQALGGESGEIAAGYRTKRGRRSGENELLEREEEYEEEDSDTMSREDSDQEENKSCFTSYSMTSSVMRRSAGLSLLDQKFETLFEKEYGDETEIGPLDVEEIEGRVDPNHSQLMKNLIKEMKGEAEPGFNAKAYISENHFYEDDGERAKEGPVVEIEIDEKGGRDGEERFDCESILSTYSNLYNHPKLIYEQKVCKSPAKVRVNPKTGIPVDSNRSTLTACNLKRLDVQKQPPLAPDEEIASQSTALERMSHLSIRPKSETCEEKKARKAAVKELRRERRQEKKANRHAFQVEDSRQTQESLNIRRNLAAVRLV